MKREVLAGAIHVLDGVFDNSDEIIQILEDGGAWDDAAVGSGAGQVDGSIRSNKSQPINPFDFRTDLRLYAFARTVWEHVNDYAIELDVAFMGMEPIVVNRYMPGDRYLAHADAGPGHQRVISAVAYLNDVEQGGETYFPLFDVSVRPKAGRLAIFPSNYAYRHAAMPPLTKVKYAAAVWMLGN